MTTIIIYKAKDGYRWQMKRSGRIVGESGEAYKRLQKAAKSLDKTISDLSNMKYKIHLPE